MSDWRTHVDAAVAEANRLGRNPNWTHQQIQKKTMNTWIIGDLHFGHQNMIPYCGRPKNFDNLIIRNWNKLVQPDDRVIVLGDVIMGEKAAERLPAIMAQLPGKKILVRGNHDVEKKWGTDIGFMQRGFDFVVDSYIYEDIAYSHCPLTPLPRQNNHNWKKEVSLNIHAHFHNSTMLQNSQARPDELYDWNYYLAHQEKYHLIQIEDQLSPVLLQKAIGDWLAQNGGEKE